MKVFPCYHQTIHPILAEYDDGVTCRLVERITVVDAKTIQVQLKDTDVEIEQKMC